jgi:acyl carrier protein
MVPSAYVYLESLPLTPNGKIDRLNLPVPARNSVEVSRACIEPRTALEERIAQIWVEVLNLEQVGVGDNFFDLGGHSLLTVQVISRINSDLSANLSIRTLFESPTIAQLARAVEMGKAGLEESEDVDSRSPYIAKLRQGQSNINLFCFLTYAGFLGEYGPNFLKLVSAMGAESSVYVLLARGVDGTSPLCSTVHQLAAEYIEEIKNIQAHGPYYLIGDCYNGVVGAYETAQQLIARGEKVEFLAFLDAPYSGQFPWSRLWYRMTARARFWLWIERFHNWNQIKQITGRLVERIGKLKAAKGWIDPIGKLFSSIKFPGDAPLTRSRNTSSPKDTAKLIRKKTRYMLRGARSYFLAMSRYKLQPYPGRISLFMNEQWYKAGHARSWAKFHDGEIDVCQLPGDHSTCMELGAHIVAQHVIHAIVPKSATDKRQSLDSDEILDDRNFESLS